MLVVFTGPVYSVGAAYGEIYGRSKAFRLALTRSYNIQ